MRIFDLPEYLQAYFNVDSNSKGWILSLATPKLEIIANKPSVRERYSSLLLLRHQLTHAIANFGQCYPPYVLDRALCYEALGFDDLAAFDAYVVYELSLQVLNDEWVTDLEARNYNLERTPWRPDDGEAREYLVRATAVLVRTLIRLGATNDAAQKKRELQEQLGDIVPELSAEEKERRLESSLKPASLLHSSKASDGLPAKGSDFGLSRREIYPWNTHEPERNTPASVKEINGELQKVAKNLEAKVTALPALDASGGTWYQLGLFAKRDLPPGEEILREKSVLTAIRPIGDAICDACGQDLETVSVADREECPGVDCDLTFCSQDCATRAANEYHQPALTILESDDSDQDEEADPPPPPFCSNPFAEDITLIGRNTTTTTPEWDLYFLLLTRTIAMSVTQSVHPLSLPSTKHLWADLIPSPTYTDNPSSPPQHTLPFSLRHTIANPLAFFTTLSSSLPPSHPSRPLLTPYTKLWLEAFDPWILQTLYAKFRGVANAQQSTFDGKAEIASVHPMWCLANHSCAPNVEWRPGGERVFTVRKQPEGTDMDGDTDVNGGAKKWAGIKEGEEVFSHYTDVRLGVVERRERLQEVLGGQCQCGRCVRESGIGKC